jgi:hypothetical protein
MTATVQTPAPSTERPIVKTTTRELTYFGARCIVVVEHHDKRRDGLRTVTTTWIDQADERNGGRPAGTVERKVMKGDGRRIDGTFLVLSHEIVSA